MGGDLIRRSHPVDFVVPDGQVWTLTEPTNFRTITLGGWSVIDLNGMGTCDKIVWSRHDVPAIVVHSINHLEIGGGTQAQHKQIDKQWHARRAEVVVARRDRSAGPLIYVNLVAG